MESSNWFNFLRPRVPIPPPLNSSFVIGWLVAFCAQFTISPFFFISKLSSSIFLLYIHRHSCHPPTSHKISDNRIKQNAAFAQAFRRTPLKRKQIYLLKEVRSFLMIREINYWLSEHPVIVGFRWSHAKLFGSTWSFLISALSIYFFSAMALYAILSLSNRRRPIPLGPIPAIHSLLMAMVSGVIFLGILLSTVAEIRDTRWAWRGRTRNTPIQWLLCFPPGTRPSGRVFFWSYAFYLSRFLHLSRAYLAILRRKRAPVARVFSHGALVAMSFLWLEFSQSFQVIAILSTTLAYAVVFGYRFWAGVGLPVATGSAPVVLACQCMMLFCNFFCHFGFIFMHFGKGGCSGIGAWIVNTMLNAIFLGAFLHFYGKRDYYYGSNHGRYLVLQNEIEEKKKIN